MTNSRANSSLVKIASLDVTTGTFDFTSLSLNTSTKYSHLIVFFEGIRSESSSIRLQINGVTGSTYYESYVLNSSTTVTGVTATAQASQIISPASTGNFKGNLTVQQDQADIGFTSIVNKLADSIQISSGYETTDATIVTQIKIFTSAGTLTGKATLYGVSK